MSGLATANGSLSDRGLPRAVIGVVADEETRASIEQAAARRAIPCAIELGDIDLALSGIHPEETADCIVIDLDGVADAVDDVAVLATGLPAQTRLVLLGHFTPEQERDLLQAGAAICLGKPLTLLGIDRLFGGAAVAAQAGAAAPQPSFAGIARPAQAVAPPAIAIRAPAERQETPAEPSPPVGPTPARPSNGQGRVITVLGCRGGVGASATAIGLAWILSEDLGHSTALLDLDPFYGSVALSLNLDPGDALQQALERPTRIDSVFLDRAVRKVGQRLFVLSSELSLERPTSLDAAGPAALVRSLTGRYERVVVDLPRTSPDSVGRVLALSDEILLVTDLSLAGARDAMRLMSLVRSATPYARVRVVVGGARESGKSPVLTPAEFRSAVGIAIDIAIPCDPETASDAARSGRAMPKAFPRSPASKALRTLAQSLESSEPRDQKRRLLFWKK